MSTDWTPEETALLKAARRCTEETPPDTRKALIDGLLNLILVVFERAHRHGRSGLRPSIELTRMIHLLGRPRLFPEGAALHARMSALLTLIEQSPQRPVLSGSALIALELELAHGWSADADLRTRALAHCEKAQNPVTPLIALEGQLLGASVATKRLEWQPFDDRRQRLLELIDVVDTYPDAAAVQTLVSDTFEGVFDGLDGSQKSILARRLLKELGARGALERYDQWTLLVNPLLLANRHDAPLQEAILHWVRDLDSARLTPYVRFYLETIEPGRMVADLVALAGRCGVSVLPLLAPVKRHRGFWGRSAVAQAGEAAYARIVEREGLEGVAGGLALATDGTEGALSVAEAHHGPLSVGAPPSATPGRPSRRRIWYGVGLSATGLATWYWLL